MEVTAELVVVDALLQTDQDVVQLDVELSALLDKDGQVLCDDNSLIDLRKELVLGGVVTNC